MYERKTPQKMVSGVDTVFYLLRGKWKPDIVQFIHQGVRRPSAIQKKLTDANARVLSQQMRELENCGIITKKVYPGIPLKVEYFLTDIGEDLMALLFKIETWGSRYREVAPIPL